MQDLSPNRQDLAHKRAQFVAMITYVPAEWSPGTPCPPGCAVAPAWPKYQPPTGVGPPPMPMGPPFESEHPPGEWGVGPTDRRQLADVRVDRGGAESGRE